MSTPLKQSTAATIPLGPFVDASDGFTAEGSLTISQADIRVSKNGAAFAQTNNSAGATHMENGFYSVPLDTTDTNTVGRLILAVSEGGARPVVREFEVLDAISWNREVLGYEYAENGGRIWYISTAGDNSNPGTRGLPKQTFSSTQTSASAGDTIVFLPGTFTTGITISKTLTIQGYGLTSILEVGSGNSVTVSANNVTIRNMVITNSTAIGLSDQGTNGLTVEGCIITGVADACHVGQSFNCRLINNQYFVTYDAIVTGVNTLIDGGYFEIDGANDTPSRGIVVAAGSCIIRNINIYNLRTANTAQIQFGVYLANGVTCDIDTALIYVESQHASATGRVVGVGVDSSGANVAAANLNAVYISTAHANGGAICRDLDFSTSGSISALTASRYTTAKAVGTVVPIDSTVSSTNTRALLAIPAVAPAANGGLPTVNASNQVAGVSGNVVGSVGSVSGNVGGNVVGSVGSVSGAVGSVTGNVGGNVVGSVGSVSGAVGSVTGNVGGNVTGSVASVTAPVTVGTNNDKTGYGLADDAITAAKFDESTAFPLKQADTGSTAVLRTGADGDTGESLSDQLDDVELAAAGDFTDPDFDPIPTQRTWVLVQTSSQGLVGDSTKSMGVGEAAKFAWDFRNDLSTNGRIVTAATPTIVTGTAGGVTFGTPGRDRAQGKVRITGITAGTYVLGMRVTYNDGDTAEGRVTLKVVQ